MDTRPYFLNYWKELEKYPHCVNLGMGMPSPEVFAPLLEANKEFAEGRKAWQANYQHQAGDKPLREAIATFESSRTGIPYTADNIMITAGAIRGFSLVLNYLANKDRNAQLVEIIPSYPLLSGNARFVAEAFGQRIISLVPEDNTTFQITFDEIEPYIQPSTILYFTNPNGPTGLYLPEDVLAKIVKTSEKVGAYVIVDEACNIPIKQDNHIKFWTDNPILIRIISLSKTYLLAGFRLGYIVAPPALIQAFADRYSFSDGNAPRVPNQALLRYLESPLLLSNISKIVQAKVQLALRELENSRNILQIIKPEACFYIFLKVDYPLGSWDLFKKLAQMGINVVPGVLFGVDIHQSWIRVCCARQDHILVNQLLQLKIALAKLITE